MARYKGDVATQQAVIRAQLDVVLSNLPALARFRSGAKMQEAARDFKRITDGGASLTAAQASYLDGIYERVMQGSGYEHVPLKVDKKRRTSLRFG